MTAGFFGLRRIAPLVASHAPPEGPFDPAGAWEHRYRIFTLAGAGLASQGTLALARRPLGPEEAELSLSIDRPTISGFSHFTRAVLRCRNDALSTPLHWTVSTKVARRPDDPAYLSSGMDKAAAWRRGEVVFTCGDDRRRVPVDGPFTCRYNLLDAVQRMRSGGPAAPVFSLMDELDEPSGGHRIAFREEAGIPVRGGTAPLRLFVHVGTGLVPAEYWTDVQGRMLFFVSGIEVLVLEAENGAEIEYRRDADVYRDAVRAVAAKGGAQ